MTKRGLKGVLQNWTSSPKTIKPKKKRGLKGVLQNWTSSPKTIKPKKNEDLRGYYKSGPPLQKP